MIDRTSALLDAQSFIAGGHDVSLRVGVNEMGEFTPQAATTAISTAPALQTPGL